MNRPHPAKPRRADKQLTDDPSTLDRLMTVEEVAEFLCVPVNTLYQWRHKGTGPTAFRVGRYLRYDPSKVRSWLHENSGTDHGVH